MAEKAFQEGQKVRVRCLIGPGPTPGERLITVQGTNQGDITGFVQDIYVNRSREDEYSGFVMGEILTVAPAEITVRIPGSFFTTATGQASLPKEKAQESLAFV